MAKRCDDVVFKTLRGDGFGSSAGPNDSDQALSSSSAASGLGVFTDGLPAGADIFGVSLVTASFNPIQETSAQPPTEDIAIDPKGQTVGAMVDQMNPSGFVNASGLVIGIAAAIPTGMAAVTEVAAMLTGTTTLSSAIAQPTMVIGQLTDTSSYIGQAGYNALSTAAYSPEVQATWIGQVATSGQSVMLATQAPATASMTAAESGFLQTVLGYTQIGSFLVPPLP